MNLYGSVFARFALFAVKIFWPENVIDSPAGAVHVLASTLDA
jgi:hypothetical protein